MPESIRKIVVEIEAQKSGFESFDSASSSLSDITTRMKGAEAAAEQLNTQITKTYREFTKGKMGPYMAEVKQQLIESGEAAGKTGAEINKLAHTGAVQRMSREWAEYKKSVQDAGAAVAQIKTPSGIEVRDNFATVQQDLDGIIAALNSLPKNQVVNVEASGASQQVDLLADRLRGIQDIRISAHTDIQQTLAALTGLRDKFTELAERKEVSVSLNQGALYDALNKIDTLQNELSIIKPLEVTGKADFTTAISRIDELETVIKSLPPEYSLQVGVEDATAQFTDLKNKLISLQASNYIGIDISKAQESLTKLHGLVNTTRVEPVALDADLSDLKAKLSGLEPLLNKTISVDQNAALVKIQAIQDAIKALPQETQLKLNTAETETLLEQVKAQIAEPVTTKLEVDTSAVPTLKTIKVDVDTSSVDAAAGKVAAASPRLFATVDTASAEAAISRLRQQIESPAPSRMKVVVDSNVSDLRHSLEALDTYLQKSVTIDKTQAVDKIADVEKAINALPLDVQLKINTAEAETALKSLKTEMNAAGTSTMSFSDRLSASAASLEKVGHAGHTLMSVMDRVEISQLSVASAQATLTNAQVRYNEAVRKYGENSREAFIASNELERAQNSVETAAKRSSLSIALSGVTMVGMIPQAVSFARGLTKSLKEVEVATLLTTTRLKALAPELLVLSAIGGAYFYLTQQAEAATIAQEDLGRAISESFRGANEEAEKLKAQLESIQSSMRDFSQRREEREIKYKATLEIIESDKSLDAEEKSARIQEERLRYERDMLSIRNSEAELTIRTVDERLAAIKEELELNKDDAQKQAELQEESVKLINARKDATTELYQNERNLARRNLWEQKKDDRLTGYKGTGIWDAGEKPKTTAETLGEIEMGPSAALEEVMKITEEDVQKVNVVEFLNSRNARMEPMTEYVKFQVMTPEQQQEFRGAYPGTYTLYGTGTALGSIWDKITNAWDTEAAKRVAYMDMLLNQSKPGAPSQAPANITNQINISLDADSLRELMDKNTLTYLQRGVSR